MSFYKVIATSGNEIVSYSTFVRNSFEVPFCIGWMEGLFYLKYLYTIDKLTKV